MSDREALLAAITANPDEDTPRLVYADWLDEHDHAAHAEFIRVQCRLEHVPLKTPERTQLAKRSKELQTKLFGHLKGLGFESVKFRRGFVDNITTRLETLRGSIAKLTVEDTPAFGLTVLPHPNPNSFEDNATVEAVFHHETLRRCVSLDLPSLYLQASELA